MVLLVFTRSATCLLNISATRGKTLIAGTRLFQMTGSKVFNNSLILVFGNNFIQSPSDAAVAASNSLAVTTLPASFVLLRDYDENLSYNFLSIDKALSEQLKDYFRKNSKDEQMYSNTFVPINQRICNQYLRKKAR